MCSQPDELKHSLAHAVCYKNNTGRKRFKICFLFSNASCIFDQKSARPIMDEFPFNNQLATSNHVGPALAAKAGHKQDEP